MIVQTPDGLYAWFSVAANAYTYTGMSIEQIAAVALRIGWDWRELHIGIAEAGEAYARAEQMRKAEIERTIAEKTNHG